jgi:hypothetical protein
MAVVPLEGTWVMAAMQDVASMMAATAAAIRLVRIVILHLLICGHRDSMRLISTFNKVIRAYRQSIILKNDI